MLSSAPAFRTEFPNGPGGDPLVVVHVVRGGHVLLLDCGRSERVADRVLLRVRDVFLSHAHLDHWIGFDHLFRQHVHRPSRIRVHGPPGTADAVAGKLAAYAWNLVGEDETEIVAREIGEREVRTVVFRARARFRAEDQGVEPRSGDAAGRGDGFLVRAAALDHGIVSMAWALEEPLRVHAAPEGLAALGLRAGPWLLRLKERVRAEAPDDEAFEAPLERGGVTRLAVGEVRGRILRTEPGERIAYATDFAGSGENAERLVGLCSGAGTLICEAAFLEEDRALADERLHLTARRAGEIARLAGVRRLVIFHFSRRYRGEVEAHLNEAREAFGGEVAAAL